MRKILILLAFGIFAMPVFATCSINSTAPCTASVLDSNNSTLQDKYAPNPLEELKKTDSFRPQYKKPFHDELINTETDVQSVQNGQNYNSNCQFGVCLPGATSSVGD